VDAIVSVDQVSHKKRVPSRTLSDKRSITIKEISIKNHTNRLYPHCEDCCEYATLLAY